ncbi:MAG: hypothetical protein JWP59_1236 [Massilia sp.]|jgi:hypothetical protein|nr:hypothetical protein [Massilia sp.]
MRTLLLATASALCLTACSTPQERALQQQADMDRIMIEYGPACARLGFTANSDPWRNCVLQLSTRDEISRYANSNYPYGWGGPPYWRRW